MVLAHTPDSRTLPWFSPHWLQRVGPLVRKGNVLCARAQRLRGRAQAWGQGNLCGCVADPPTWQAGTLTPSTPSMPSNTGCTVTAHTQDPFDSLLLHVCWAQALGCLPPPQPSCPCESSMPSMGSGTGRRQVASLSLPHVLVLSPLHFALKLPLDLLSAATSPGALCRYDGDGVPSPGSALFHELLKGWRGPLLAGACPPSSKTLSVALC